MRVSELLPAERPRERLLRHGAASLTEVELLAVLLHTGTTGRSVIEVARDCLEQAGGVEALAGVSPQELCRRPGIGQAKAAVIAAALELGRRIAESRMEAGPLVDRPELAADVVRQRWGHERVELFGCLSLDARNRLLKVHVLHRGGRAHSPVEPAEVFHRALADNAHGVILWHTHPSGDPTPSEDDVQLTRRLAEAGRLLAVAILDHIVIGREGFVSLRQRGIL